MTIPPIVYFVSDKYLNVLRASLFLLRKYWIGAMPRVIIAGYSKPKWPIPEWAEFWSTGDFSDYPANKWSNGIIKFLDHGTLDPRDSHLIILLEDYFVLRDIDTSGIAMLTQFMKNRSDALRFDLSTDRLYCTGNIESGCVGRFDLIETKPPSDYQCSLQPGIWDRAKLRQLLREDESPWQFELSGTNRANANQWTAFGTRQAPIRVKIAVNKGVLDLDTNWQYPHAIMNPADKQNASEICKLST